MTSKNTCFTLSSLFAALILTACGSGGGGTSTAGTSPDTDTTSSTPISSSGVITGFGSVFVNGVRYELENGTVVAIEDEQEIQGSDEPLRLGMKVRIRAREENSERIAERIEYDEDLKGRVSNVMEDADDPTVGTFEIMSTTVTVDGNTVFDDDVGNNDGIPGIDIRDLDLGGPVMVVEVSGYPTPTGYLATRVDRLNTAGSGIDEDEAEVKGIITDLSGLPVFFELNNGLQVNVAGAVFDDGLDTIEDLSLELFIEVKGTRVNDAEINATEIELEDRLSDEDREGEFEIEGVLQSLRLDVEPSRVVINGITLRVEDASPLVGLVGRRIEIHGEFNSDDVLILGDGDDGVEVEEQEDNVRTRDLLREVDPTQDRLITRLGLRLDATGQSRVQDRTREQDNLTVDDFITGLQGKGLSGGSGPVIVEARGFRSGSGVTWTRISVETADGDEECGLRGRVTEVNGTASTFEIRDVVVDATASDYFDDEELPLTREQFFDALVEGVTIVQATGNKENNDPSADCSNLSLISDEVEIED